MFLEQYKALLDKDATLLSNLANTASYLWYSLENISWVGFYISKGELLHLGPFMGKPACIQIPYGRGVCGNAAKYGKIEIVEDVHKYPGHIACDSASNSELVIPIMVNNKCVAVLDLDSESFGRFTEEDAELLAEVCHYLEQDFDWSKLC